MVSGIARIAGVSIRVVSKAKARLKEVIDIVALLILYTINFGAG